MVLLGRIELPTSSLPRATPAVKAAVSGKFFTIIVNKKQNEEGT